MEGRDDAPLANDSGGGVPPNDGPSGLPEGEEEHAPLGTPGDTEPEGDGEIQRGADAQPGINTGEPDVSG